MIGFLTAAFWASAIASSSLSFSSTSILGNKFSPFTSLVPAIVPSKDDNEAQSVLEAFICLFIFSDVSGKNDDNKTDDILKDSIKLYKTVPNLPFFSSSLANIQGVVSSIYLLALPIRVNTCSIASGMFNLSIEVDYAVHDMNPVEKQKENEVIE